VNFSLDAAPDPVAEFFYSPGDPSPYEAVQFFDNSFDPGGSGFASRAWDFGDGTTLVNPGQFPTHQFPTDGEYTVELAVTTPDGRHASVSKTIRCERTTLRSRPLRCPNAARAGQTRAVSVGIVNTRYPEPVQVQLFKSVPGGFQQIGSLTQDVPVRGANRTTTFGFTYTFTAADAAVGRSRSKLSLS
jgi:PKD repeat protein